MNAPVDDGYVKYTSVCRDGTVPTSAALDELNRARTVLFDLRLVGAYPNGVGYGNLSIRTQGLEFVITASATGSLRTLQHAHYCLVESFSVEGNWVHSRGGMQASSESMTHGAIYAAHPQVYCVMHVHSRALFDDLIDKGSLTTPADVPYGTPAMAQAVSALVASQSGLPIVFAMEGHDEGVVAYGQDIASTLTALIELLKRTASL